MTAKQTRFCKEYIKDLNATQAAIRAGFSVKTAYSSGSRLLKDVEVKATIAELLKEKTIGADETIKLISDISRSSLNDYMVIKKVKHYPEVEKSLRQLIKEAKALYEFEEEYADRAGLTEMELVAHQKMQKGRELDILRMEMELERSPRAKRIVTGEPIFIEVAELDMAKLTRDKDAGRIKSIKHGQYGPQVELYAADAALKEMAKLHNLYTTKVELTGKDGDPLFEGFDAFMAECKNIKLEDDEQGT